MGVFGTRNGEGAEKELGQRAEGVGLNKVDTWELCGWCRVKCWGN